jgi:hypothetical protein
MVFSTYGHCMPRGSHIFAIVFSDCIVCWNCGVQKLTYYDKFKRTWLDIQEPNAGPEAQAILEYMKKLLGDYLSRKVFLSFPHFVHTCMYPGHHASSRSADSTRANMLIAYVCRGRNLLSSWGDQGAGPGQKCFQEPIVPRECCACTGGD